MINFSFLNRGISLNLVHLMKSLYNEVYKMYISDILPESKVDFLPESYKLPDTMDDWLLADETLRDAFHL